MTARPLLITGGRGTLGQACRRLCLVRGLAHVVLTRDDLDICDRAEVDAALAAHRPWAVVNGAGYVRVDDAERDGARCRHVNVRGAANLADACTRAGVRLVTFSSDLVFDGTKGTPYDEHDRPTPLGEYGRSKMHAEARVLAAHPEAIVVRTSAFFGPWDAHNFVTLTLARLRAGHPVHAADDVVVSPTYVPDLVNVALDLLIDGERGIWHLSNHGAVSWFELARTAARIVGIADPRIEARPAAALGACAPRPRMSALVSARGMRLPELDEALARYLTERDAA